MYARQPSDGHPPISVEHLLHDRQQVEAGEQVPVLLLGGILSGVSEELHLRPQVATLHLPGGDERLRHRGRALGKLAALVLAGVDPIAAGRGDAQHVLAAADFPVKDKPITIVVPFTAGGPTDRVARDLAEALRKPLDLCSSVR